MEVVSETIEFDAILPIPILPLLCYSVDSGDELLAGVEGQL